ncbi:MAG: hypothetical protein GXY36_06385 [Chloroflexi bacterium]|nr:hypothetical protein [Chloroflexota bacterium]
MWRRLCLLITVIIILAAGTSAIPARVHAQASVSAQAWTPYAITVYRSPDRSDHIVGVLAPETGVQLEGRTSDTAWVLTHSLDGIVRGWVDSGYLEYAPDIDITGLPISDEEMFVPLPFAPGRYRNIDLSTYPVVPTDLGQARAIFESGQQQNRKPTVVSKIGDCLTDNQYFLSPFGWHEYNLGNFVQLQEVISHFSLSLSYDSLAAYDGLVTTAVLDPAFANPMACLPGESPLRCEYRIRQPSVAVIMFGAQDLLFTSPADFDRSLRRIVHETIQAGVIPILSTFPGNVRLWDESVEYNQIVVLVALDYNVPLINLWRALEPLPNHGLNTDGRHLSLPVTTGGDLTGDNLRQGYPLRNLVTLQTLDALWRTAMQQPGA